MDKEIEKKCEKVIEYRFSDPRKAYNICSEILEHGIRNEEAYEVAYARLYMGDTMFSMGEFQKALANMMLAKKVQEKYGYQDLLMKTYNIIAIIYVNQGDDLLGLDYYYKSLKLARECGNKVMMRMVYNNIGALLNNAGDAAGAAEYFRKVYELCQKREQRDSKKIDNKKQYLVNLAVGYLGEKKYEQARKYLDMASMESDGKSQDCCSAAEINRIVDSVRVYVETGNKAAAIKEAENILSLPEKKFEDVEAFRHFICLASCLLQLEYFVSRYGEDEFVILGINKSDEELIDFIEKLFCNINSAKMPFLDHMVFQHVTISMGVVNKTVESGYSLAEFISSEDNNLYVAKKNGKNRYVFK